MRLMDNKPPRPDQNTDENGPAPIPLQPSSQTPPQYSDTMYGLTPEQQAASEARDAIAHTLKGSDSSKKLATILGTLVSIALVVLFSVMIAGYVSDRFNIGGGAKPGQSDERGDFATVETEVQAISTEITDQLGEPRTLVNDSLCLEQKRTQGQSDPYRCETLFDVTYVLDEDEALQAGQTVRGIIDDRVGESPWDSTLDGDGSFSFYREDDDVEVLNGMNCTADIVYPHRSELAKSLPSTVYLQDDLLRIEFSCKKPASADYYS